MMGSILPKAGQVTALFSTLFGRDLDVKSLPPRQPAVHGFVATYETEEHQVVALVSCELALACYCGAALALVPARVAQAAVRAGTIPEDLLSNAHEVFNIAAQLFRGPGTERIALGAIHDEQLPPALASMLGRTTSRLNLELSIAGYGAGKLSISTVTPPE